eukprot:533503_1
MATDLMNELGNTYESNYAASALRASKWQNPQKQNANQGGYGSNESIPLSSDIKTNTNNSRAIGIDDLDDEFLRMRQDIKNEISNIINNAQSVKNLCGQYKLATTDEYPNIMSQMDTLVQKNTALTTQIKWRIQTEKRNLSKECDNIDSLKIREFNGIVMNFKNACNMFSQTLNKWDATVKNEQIRQLSVVDLNNTLTEEDKNKLLNSDDFLAVQKFIDEKYKLTDASNDELLNRLTDLEKQHNGLIKIEESVKELKTLFNELNILVIEQQDLIDSVEHNVVETKELVKSGTKHLEKAEKHQKKTRKMMLCGIICCIIILLIIIIAVAT